MNDQTILEVLAAGTDLRRVQIADKLDMLTDDVQALLSGLVAVGDVLETDGTGPNGLPCKLYNLSPAFRRSERYNPIAMKVSAAKFAQLPGAGRVDRAIAFIRDRGGEASSSELHAMLGLAPEQLASTALAAGIREKKLVKVGKIWTVGPAAEAALPIQVAEADLSPALVDTAMPSPVPPSFGPSPVLPVAPVTLDDDVGLPQARDAIEAFVISATREEALTPGQDAALKRYGLRPFASICSQVDPSSALPSHPAGDTPADHPPLEHMLNGIHDPANYAALAKITQVRRAGDRIAAPAPVGTPGARKYPAFDNDESCCDHPLAAGPDLSQADPVIVIRGDLRYPSAADRREVDPAVTAVAPLRFGIWSDGFVELQRAGTTVATLTRADAEALADHMISLRGAA